ncbi:hypothetical protein [Streptomyces sp. SCL15-4]|uniref:hypothetical protein n=1 Tax=Streptomyces sp. SCL15-4 TaxID=2967221 RepID=UPI002965FE81|nr:hypothetical protein [Streptomyces sp. SCL15-4]
MGTNVTEPNAQASPRPLRPISEQRAAAEALVALTEMLGSLPGGYIKIHQPYFSPAWMGIQFETPQAFELWREALCIPGADVSLHATSDAYVWLGATTVFRGVRIELTGFDVPLTAEQATTPQVTGEAPAVAA